MRQEKVGLLSLLCFRRPTENDLDKHRVLILVGLLHTILHAQHFRDSYKMEREKKRSFVSQFIKLQPLQHYVHKSKVLVKFLKCVFCIMKLFSGQCLATSGMIIIHIPCNTRLVVMLLWLSTPSLRSFYSFCVTPSLGVQCETDVSRFP